MALMAVAKRKNNVSSDVSLGYLFLRADSCCVA